jgi:hypothetical protein
MNQLLISSVWQHSLNPFLIAVGHHHVDIEISFSLIGFLGQDMARVRMTTLDLPSRGRAKSLGRSSMCLKFRHNSP